MKKRRRGYKNPSWDKEHYKAIKVFMDEHIRRVHFTLVDKYKNDPAGWAKTFLPLMNESQLSGDYEAAQAVKDAIVDFLNNFGAELKDNVVFKVQDYRLAKMNGIICYGKEDDPSGMASGGAVFIQN